MSAHALPALIRSLATVFLETSAVRAVARTLWPSTRHRMISLRALGSSLFMRHIQLTTDEMSNTL